MSGIASLALAALVLNDLVTTIIDQLPFAVPYFKFYVDDYHSPIKR